jgi:uncharacterized protein CbrC (UPF0167 family)
MMQFQQWLYEKWLEHCEEYLQLFQQMPNYDVSEYYERYGDWLNEQYEKGQNNDGADSKTDSKE